MTATLGRVLVLVAVVFAGPWLTWHWTSGTPYILWGVPLSLMAMVAGAGVMWTSVSLFGWMSCLSHALTVIAVVLIFFGFACVLLQVDTSLVTLDDASARVVAFFFAPSVGFACGITAISYCVKWWWKSNDGAA